MNIYKIHNDEFEKKALGADWYNPFNNYFITCEGREMPAFTHLFGLDQSTVEECLSVDQSIKFESFDGYDFTTFNFITHNSEETKAWEVNIYASSNYIILVYDKSLESLSNLELGIINKRYNMLQKKGSVLNKIYYLVFDRTISAYFNILEEIEDMIEEIEENILTDARKRYLDEILTLKTKISFVRKNISPLAYVGDALLINDNNIISKPMYKYFTSLDLRINKLNDFSNNLRYLINEARNAYDSKISSKTNDKATLITIIAAFFAPPTVIAGIYGMNFEHMPELSWKFGYPFSIFLMIAASVIMYVLLKSKKWL